MPMTKPTAKRKPKAKKAEPVGFVCGFCNKTFLREPAFVVHMCVRKQRDLEKNDKNVRMALQVYRKFYDTNTKGQPKGWDDFIASRFYNDFIKVGRYIIEINPVNTPQFVDFLVRSGLPVNRWTSPAVYETYVRELTKKESPDAAVERNILLMQQWATENNQHWTDFFRLVSPAQATLWIRTGRISPWVIYITSSSEMLFNRMSSEQIELIRSYIDPGFWQLKMDKYPTEVKFLKQIFDEAGV